MDRTCRVCKKTKPVSEFCKKAQRPDGLDNRCKSCKREYDNQYYKSNPNRKPAIRAHNDKRIQSIRDWTWDYLSSHPCLDCGESDPVVLEFDHRENKERALAEGMTAWSLSHVKEEVKKCDVRCANCHRKKTARQFGYWKTKHVMPL